MPLREVDVASCISPVRKVVFLEDEFVDRFLPIEDSSASVIVPKK